MLTKEHIELNDVLRRSAVAPALLPGQIHVWRIPVNDSIAMPAMLSRDEIARAERLKKKHDQRRYLLARSVLRALLSNHAQNPAEQLQFQYGAYGKPYVDPNRCDVQFNVSHSSDLILIALTKSASVGVDVERIEPDTDVASLSKRFFTEAEQLQLSGVSQSQQGEEFFKIWTKKEAYLKARGTGFSQHFTNISAPSQSDETGFWSVFNIPSDPQYAAALAIHFQSPVTLASVQFFHWS
jgi:4'-phosphopantetheinyl transferase